MQVGSGGTASTSGRSCHMAPVSCGPSAWHYFPPVHFHRSRSMSRSDSCTSTPLLLHGLARHRTRLVPATPAVCQAQKTKQESERPVMERLESDLIAGVESNGNGNGVKRNGSKAPSRNSATNVADRMNAPPAQTSQDDEDNVDSGEQSQSSNGGTVAKAASNVPGGITAADSMSAPKPASFWLPQPEVMHQVQRFAFYSWLRVLHQPAVGAIGVCLHVRQTDSCFLLHASFYAAFPLACHGRCPHNCQHPCLSAARTALMQLCSLVAYLSGFAWY